MATHQPEPRDDDLRAPESLITALAELPRARVFVPEEVDAAILKGARRNLSKRRRRSQPFMWLSAAAALIIAGWLGWTQLGTRIAREDVNGDGLVDIRDALALARQISSGATEGNQWDLNRDGVIDQRDVELIAKHAVKLSKGGAS